MWRPWVSTVELKTAISKFALNYKSTSSHSILQNTRNRHVTNEYTNSDTKMSWFFCYTWKTFITKQVGFYFFIFCCLPVSKQCSLSVNILKQNNLCEKDFCICTQGELSIKPRVGVCMCVCTCVPKDNTDRVRCQSNPGEGVCWKKGGVYGRAKPFPIWEHYTGHPKENWGRWKDRTP